MLPRHYDLSSFQRILAYLCLQTSFRYEFKSNYEEWIKSVKPKFGPDVSVRVNAAIKTTYENIKILYKVRTEMRAALQSLLKVFFYFL